MAVSAKLLCSQRGIRRAGQSNACLFKLRPICPCTAPLVLGLDVSDSSSVAKIYALQRQQDKRQGSRKGREQPLNTMGSLDNSGQVNLPNSPWATVMTGL